MSKKVLGIALEVAGFALMFVPGIGPALGLGAKILGVALSTVVGLGLEIAGSLLMGPSKPKADLLGSQVNRLTATLIPTTPRKIVFGITAGDTDVRYQAYTGTNQEYLDMIVCHASHEVHSIDELWLDNEQAWTSGGGVQGRYVGYLTVDTRTVGTSANGIAIDGTWTSHCTLTGCAYSHYRFKLTGNSSSQSSPFSSGVTSRMTVRVHGAKVYDPRLDSTVAGGSGSQRATDQTTWAWDDNASRNPALQELFYELGWQINSKLAVGKGVPPARIDLASYAVGANTCDESITLNGGGTEPRYRSDGVISEADDPGTVRDNLCSTMYAMLRDSGGKLSLTVVHNDLGTPVAPTGKTSFDQYDIQAELQWEQTPDLHQSFNVVRGQRIDPSNTALYQPVDFPEARLTSNDGIDRIDSINFPLVQSNGQAQRLAKQRLQRNQYQGKLTFTGQPSFWGINLGDVFALSHPAFGWSGKLFRCASQQISRTGATQIVAVEENAAIYAWSNNEAAAVTPGAPVVYDPRNSALVVGINVAAAASAPGDGNRVRFSRFEKETTGWTSIAFGGTTLSSLAVTRGAEDTLVLSGTFAANGDKAVLLNNSTLVGGSRAYRIPVTVGERLFVGCEIGIAATGVSFELLASFKDDADAFVQDHPAIASGTGNATGGGFVTVPVGAVYLSLELDLTNVSGGAQSFTLAMARPMVCGAGAAQTVWPAFSPGPSSEPGAEVNRWITDPPQRQNFKYDYTGVAQSGEFSRDLTFKLMQSAGQITSGVTWSGLIISGTYNTVTSAFGSFALPVSSGVGTLGVSSLGSSQAVVQVTANYLGFNYTKEVTLTQDIAAPPVSTGSGGGATTIASQSSFASFSTATFAEVTSGPSGAMPTGKTTATISVQLDAMPSGASTGGWTIEAKVTRDIGGTPTQIGSTQSKSSDWSSTDHSGDAASFNFTISDTGLTAGTTYVWRVYMRVASGGTQNHSVTGSVSVTA